MNVQLLKDALLAIPAGQHGAVMVKGTPIEIQAFSWSVENELMNDYRPTLRISKEDGSFCLVEITNIDWFYTYPITKGKIKR